MSGQNVFSRNDVITMAVIFNLVRVQGLSLKEARTALGRIIQENEGKVENIMLVQQFELELTGNEQEDHPEARGELPAEDNLTDSNEDSGAVSNDRLNSTKIPAAKPVVRYTDELIKKEIRAELKALADEVQALEDENTCLSNQLSIRMQETADMKAQLSASLEQQRSLKDNITSIVSNILQSLSD